MRPLRRHAADVRTHRNGSRVTAPLPESKAGVRTDAVPFESPRPGPVATAFGLLFRVAWNAGTAWGASRVGRAIAEDAGMASRALRVEACPLLIAGLVGGLLLRTRPEARDRLVPFLALAIGAAAGLAVATPSALDVAVRWPIFVAPAAFMGFARAIFRG
jgi:hypothetical protein